VREYCGEVEADALGELKSLPECHLDWDHTNLDVPGTDHAQADIRARQDSEVADAHE
jgi:hypothetical protein